MIRRVSHVIGFDDAPFGRNHRGDVRVIGAVFAGPRLEGVLSGKVRRDGANSTATLIKLVSDSRFAKHMQALLVQGIALAGFNVLDLHALHCALRIPVVAVARKAPDMQAIKRALLSAVPGGRSKWRLIEKLGPMEPLADVYVQYVGISRNETQGLIQRFAINSVLPEPLRTAHIIASGVTLGESKHRA